VAVNEVQGLALAGTPTDPGLPSANAGQTIHIIGDGITLSTEVVFPTIDPNGNRSTAVVRPDLASVDGTMAELRVPNNAITGDIQVVGAAGTFPLQIVPTLKRVEPFSGGQVRLLGSGFTEDSDLSVDFNGTVVADTGTNVNVDYDSFLNNDTLLVTIPPGGSSPVSVVTAGGRSQAVPIATDDPASVAGMRGLAVFPATAGPDAGRLVVADTSGSGALRVLEPATLALVRTIDRPGASTYYIGVAFLGAPVTVHDAVRGDVAVPAGSLVAVNGSDTPDRLYYLDPTATGTVLADVELGGPTPVDEAGAVAVAYHPTRGTLFVQRTSDLITEVDPATGAALTSFHTGFDPAYERGGLAVHPTRGTLLAGGASNRLIEVDPDTGRLVGVYDPIGDEELGTVDLRQQGAYFQSFYDVTGLAFDGAGQLLATLEAGRIVEIDLPGAPTAIQVCFSKICESFS